jgi:hypothetical protein
LNGSRETGVPQPRRLIACVRGKSLLLPPRAVKSAEFHIKPLVPVFWRGEETDRERSAEPIVREDLDRRLGVGPVGCLAEYTLVLDVLS